MQGDGPQTMYDPSGSIQTGENFSIPCLSGSASGPNVWDKVSIGGYVVDNQAFATNPSGVLGLALPLNSIIAQRVWPGTDNNPDGAAWASNLFSLTPTNVAPSSQFLSLALSRPGSTQIPSSHTIFNASGDTPGTLFWKVTVTAITVYVNGTTQQIQVGRSISGRTSPIAILDSGVPLILTTTAIANGIYGAIGIRPAQDGMYYVPCNTPLNMTISLDDRPEIPLHPLDLTAEPPQDNQSQFCTGLIQIADAQLLNSHLVEDMVLGVPFMRNVYTVMAYTTPNPDGSFPPSDNQTDGGALQTIKPQLGLMSLTNPTQALQEFNTARMSNQPISTNGNGNGDSSMVNVGGKRLSVGIMVLIGILSFFALSCLLFVVRWFIYRRKYREKAGGGGGKEDRAGDALKMDRVAFMDASPMQDRMLSTTTISSAGTQVTDYEPLGYGYGHGYGYGYGKDDDEFGVKLSLNARSKMRMMRCGVRKVGLGLKVGVLLNIDDKQVMYRWLRTKTTTTIDKLQNEASPHRQSSSLAVPLLSQEETPAEGYDPFTPYKSSQPQDSCTLQTVIPYPEDLGEFGLMGFDGMSTTQTMVGVGTASRTKKIGPESKFGRDSLLSTQSSNVGAIVDVGGGGNVNEGNNLGGRRSFGNSIEIPSESLPSSLDQGQGREGTTRMSLLSPITRAHGQPQLPDLR
ncbi:acid protease [Phlegmacium glaucopus]|nr:acid protease [Phlegmacium glaucopus]